MTMEEKAYNYAIENVCNNCNNCQSKGYIGCDTFRFAKNAYMDSAKENGIQWHDLEKDSNDLPKENKQYLCKLKWFVGGGISYECLYWNNDFDYWTDKCGESVCDKVICWYEIPQGELK